MFILLRDKDRCIFPLDSTHNLSVSVLVSGLGEWMWMSHYTAVLLYLLRLLLSSCPAKVIKVDIKPAINVTMQLIVLVADLSWCQTFFNRLCLGRCPILIGTTDVQNVIVPQPTKSTTRNWSDQFTPNPTRRWNYAWGRWARKKNRHHFPEFDIAVKRQKSELLLKHF